MADNNTHTNFGDIRNVTLKDLTNLGVVTITYVSFREGDNGEYVRILVKTEGDESFGCNIGSQIVMDRLKIAPSKDADSWVGVKVKFETKVSASTGRTYFKVSKA